MLIKRLFSILCMFFIASAVGGCDYKDVDKVMLVAGCSVDGSPDELTVVTETVSGDGGSDIRFDSYKTESTAQDFTNIIINIDKLFGKYLSWSHMQTLVVGNDYAKKGITSLLNEMRCNNELRLNVCLLISKDCDAKDVIMAKSFGNDIHSFALLTDIKGNSRYKTYPNTSLYKVLRTLNKDGIDLLIPAITVEEAPEQSEAVLDGCAVLREAELVGYISEEETVIALLLLGDGNNSVIKIHEDTLDAELLVKKDKAKIIPHLEGNELHFDVSLRLSGEIVNKGNQESLLDDRNTEEIREEFLSRISDEINELLKKFHTVYNADILGFGYELKNEYPQYWDSVSDKWRTNTLPNINVNLDIDLSIVGSGITFD